MPEPYPHQRVETRNPHDGGYDLVRQDGKEVGVVYWDAVPLDSPGLVLRLYDVDNPYSEEQTVEYLPDTPAEVSMILDDHAYTLGPESRDDVEKLVPERA